MGKKPPILGVPNFKKHPDLDNAPENWLFANFDSAADAPWSTPCSRRSRVHRLSPARASTGSERNPLRWPFVFGTSYPNLCIQGTSSLWQQHSPTDHLVAVAHICLPNSQHNNSPLGITSFLSHNPTHLTNSPPHQLSAMSKSASRLVQRIRPVLPGRHPEAVPLPTWDPCGGRDQHRAHAAHAAAVAVFPGPQQAVRRATYVVQGHLLQNFQGTHDGQSTWWRVGGEASYPRWTPPPVNLGLR